MKIERRKQVEHQISLASRFVVFWCIGVIIGIIATAAYFF